LENEGEIHVDAILLAAGRRPNVEALLLHLASYAMHFGATVDDLPTLHHYHPTLAEMIPSLAQRVVAELDGERGHLLAQAPG
jgi:pyruvate/2-oxoglutarate dehydrogenase complex dihydrolipoamide dehydrogenase (E3) component